MIGQDFGLVCVLSFLGGHGQRRQSVGGLPGTQIDKGFLAVNKPARHTLPFEEGKMRHGVARGPGRNQA